MAITLNVKGFQDSFETIKTNEDIKLYHTYNGKDYLIDTFNPLTTKIDITNYINEYIENFYEVGTYEII